MKTLKLIILSVLFSYGLCAQSNSEMEQTGLPGDHFSLEGALELFKKSSSPEDFERQLNSKDNNVNNLDLNEDNEIDYVKVISTFEKDVQILILQVSVSADENQDIAVIEIEKSGNDQAILQIIGDEDIYGDEIIYEPSDEDDEAYDYNESSDNDMQPNVTVNVWAWPSVRYMYAPNYRPWVSPWRWGVYPNWWKPWRPLGWSVWHPLRISHHRYGYRPVRTHRIVRARSIYKPIRVTSTRVNTRYAGARTTYKATRKTTKVTGPRGNSVTKKTTTVKGRKGTVKTSKKTKVKKKN